MGSSPNNMDYLSQLELDIKKEHDNLEYQLAQDRRILRATQMISFSDAVRNPIRRKIRGPKGYHLILINLRVRLLDGDSLENKLCKILTNFYFEIEGDYTKFSNTGTLTSSRLFERYLSQYLDDQCEDIFKSETLLKLNIFNFRHAPINPQNNKQNLFLELYIQDKWDQELRIDIEYVYQKTDKIELVPRPFTRPKNGSDFYLDSTKFKTTQLIRNSGYSFGMVLSFISYLESPLFPSLENIRIYPDRTNTNYLEFGTDDFKTIETPIIKYIVLMFDPNYRSDENIADMLNGYLFDSKKIYGINFSDTTDPAINISDDFDEDEELSCCSYRLEFNELDLHGDFIVHENFYYLDCINS